MKAVNTRVNNITVTREGYNIRAKWVVPFEMIDKDNERCAEWVDSRMEFWIPGKKAAQHVEAKNKKGKGVGNPNPGVLDISFTDADFFWIRGQGTGDEVVKNFSRKRYYPHTSRKCEKVKVAAWGGNKKGNGVKLWTTYSFGLPRKPKVSWSFDDETKVATVTVKTDPGEDRYERYDTCIKVDFLAPGGKKYQPFNTSDTYKDVFSTTQTEFSLSRDMSAFMRNLTDDKPIKLRCQAYARGMLGDNPKVHEKGDKKESPVKAEMVIAMPSAATVGTVKVDKTNKSGVPLPTSRITVPIKCGENTSKVTLQRRLGGDGNSWSNVDGAVDNGNCKALYDSYGNFNNEAGQYVYYRVESENYGLKVHSAPVRANCIYVAKPKPTCTASMEILSMTQTQRTVGGSVEVGVYVRMGFTDVTANTGCELSWSEYPNAWNSNVSPSTVQVTGKDGADTTKLYTMVYKNTRGTNVYGLTPGTTYYFRMRRYREVDGETYYSGYDAKIGELKSVKVEGADAEDKCWIESAEVGDDGTSVALTVRFKEDNVNTGTEVSWSQDEHAWKSNEQPSTMDATWKTSEISGEWTHVQDVYLRGLERGMKYYAYARRYQDHTGGRSYAPYSKQFTFTTPLSSAASSDVRCGLVSVDPNGGTGAVVVIGWDGSHTGCEASWSTDPDAWESSTAPSTFEFDWQDSLNKSGFVKTEDEAIDPSKTYYTRTGSGTDESPYVYEKVESPVEADLGSYYEVPWSHTSTCYIAGLEEGSTYYVKARSYYGDGDDRKWSEYTSPLTVIPYAAPDSVVLDAPTTATDAEGSSIELYWSVGSEMPQTEWNLYQSDVTPDKLILSGTGSLCRASLPWWRFSGLESISFYLEAACGGGFTRSNVVTVVMVKQPECYAAIAPVLTEQPASFEVYADRADVSVLATCRSQGITMTLPDGEDEQVEGDVVWTAASSPAFAETTWGETAYRQRLADAVTAAQAEVDSIEAEIAEMGEDDPQLVIAQNSLDAANARLAAAQAAKQADLDGHPADGTVYAATVELPTIDLYDGGSYVISVQTAESVAGLASDVAELPFTVDYEHKAADPTYETTVVPDVEARAARVNLVGQYELVKTKDTEVDPTKTYYDYYYVFTPDEPRYGVHENPTKWELKDLYERIPLFSETDVFDVYRKTQDGYDLIASNVPAGGNVYDTFAPFGNVDLAYRVCARTVDGSIAFRDFPYRMDVRGTRFDWDNRSVELPWNVETSDSYAKSFEARSHVDGSVNGYYDKAVTRTGSLSSDIMKIREQGTLELVRALGNYAGACFCRTDKGAAFQCNAELSEVGTSYSTGAVAVRFELTRMDLSEEFMVKDEEDVEDGEGQGNG